MLSPTTRNQLIEQRICYIFYKEFDLVFSNHKKSPLRTENLLDFFKELVLAFSNNRKSAPRTEHLLIFSQNLTLFSLTTCFMTYGGFETLASQEFFINVVKN